MSIYASNAGKSGGEFFTLQEVSELLTRLEIIDKTSVNKIYDPSYGSGSLLLQALKLLSKDNIKLGFYGQEKNITTYNLCRINMFLHDVGFEIELLKQVEINIDYILVLVQKYHDSHCEDKEILINIQKAIESSPEMRSKKVLIENFIKGINEVDDVISEWHSYVLDEKDKAIKDTISSENLREEATIQFITNAFETGSVKTTGTDIDKILPPISQFGSDNRDEKRKKVLVRITEYFEKFFGIS